MYKKGYENGEKVIEISNGNVDLVLYSEKKPTFYFYRFPSEKILGEKLDKDIEIYSRKEVERLLKNKGLAPYDEMVQQLLHTAITEKMKDRDEM